MTQFLKDRASDSEEVVTPLMPDGTYLSRNSATLGPMIRQPPCDRFLLAVWLMNDFHLYLLHSVINCLCLKIGSYLRSYFLSLTIINLRSVELISECQSISPVDKTRFITAVSVFILSITLLFLRIIIIDCCSGILFPWTFPSFIFFIIIPVLQEIEYIPRTRMPLMNEEIEASYVLFIRL